MNKQDKIYIAGHRGMVGSAIMRKLKGKDFSNLVTRTSSELDLRDQKEVNVFFESEKPDYVFLAAAKVGGILANNTYRGEFLLESAHTGVCLRFQILDNLIGAYTQDFDHQ